MPAKLKWNWVVLNFCSCITYNRYQIWKSIIHVLFFQRFAYYNSHFHTPGHDSDIVPLHNPSTKVATGSRAWGCLLLTVNQSERSFHSEFSGYTISAKIMFCSRSEKSSVIGSIWCLWNQSNRSKPDFQKRLLPRDTVKVRYDTTLTWEEDNFPLLFITCTIIYHNTCHKIRAYIYMVLWLPLCAL